MAVDYGSELSLLQDLDRMGAMVSGRLVLSQALIRRWTTPRGRLLDDPHYGDDVTSELGDDLGATDAAQKGSNMDAEAIKDERVVSCLTLATFANGVLTTTSTIVDGAGPFSLVLAITSVTVTILSQPITTASS